MRSIDFLMFSMRGASWILVNVFGTQKKLSKGISKQLLDQCNYLALSWPNKMISDTRKPGLNVSDFCCDLLTFVIQVYCRPVNELSPLTKTWSIVKRLDPRG